MRVLTNPSLTNSWLFKYKLYHIPFWCVYHYFYWTLHFQNAWEAANTILFSIYAVKFIFAVIFQAIGVYFNLYFLIPRYLEKGKFTKYTVYLLCTIVIVTTFYVTGYYTASWISDRSFYDLFKLETNQYDQVFVNALPSTVASMTLAMSIKLTKNWIQSTRRQQLLEKEKLETELKFLRSQFNPHFLFNTINSIFFLIHKNPVMASNSLAKFSDLLRYQLYECNESQIPLQNEVAYLESFIELEKLRHNKTLEITTEIERQAMQFLGIAPFVLITFTENAFKHVSDHKDKPNWIRLHLGLNGSQLKFKIANSVSSVKSTEIVNYGGIGLRNVKRRLDLIYPDQYQLNIQNNQNSFEVELNLALSEMLDSQQINKSA
jgi:two-component system LytT family sensor kinase